MTFKIGTFCFLISTFTLAYFAFEKSNTPWWLVRFDFNVLIRNAVICERYDFSFDVTSLNINIIVF